MKQESVSDLVSGTGRVSVRAIAAETGLSIATVSRVLNGGENVASDTRRRVSEVMERLGDRAPEPRRRAAARATRPPVFVRCPYLLTDYFGHIVTSIAETLALHEQSMLLDAGDAVVRSTVLRELPPGCAFHPRCPMAQPRCGTERPAVREIGEDASVACHLA